MYFTMTLVKMENDRHILLNVSNIMCFENQNVFFINDFNQISFFSYSIIPDLVSCTLLSGFVGFLPRLF